MACIIKKDGDTNAKNHILVTMIIAEKAHAFSSHIMVIYPAIVQK